MTTTEAWDDPGPGPARGVEDVPEQECLDLISGGGIARVGVSVGALPAILPVNYVLLGRDLYFFTAAGTKLSAAVHNTVVALEIDNIDAASRVGWSVLVVGRSEEVFDHETRAFVVRLGLLPWAAGARNHLIRVSGNLISGRRLNAQDSRAAR